MPILTHSNFDFFIKENSHVKPVVIDCLRNEMLSYSLYKSKKLNQEIPLFNQGPLVRFLASSTLWENILRDISDDLAISLTFNVLVHCYVVEYKSSDVFFSIPKDIEDLEKNLKNTKTALDVVTSTNNTLISPIQSCSNLLKTELNIDDKIKNSLEKESIQKFKTHLNHILTGIQLARAADRFGTSYFKESLDLSPFMETNNFYAKKSSWVRLFWIRFSILCFKVSSELKYVRKNAVYLANTLFDGENNICGDDIDAQIKVARLKKTNFISSYFPS